MQDENLSKIIRSKWKDSVGLDSHLKLREVKKEIISWNRSLNGDINSKIRRLENLQFVHDERGASDELKHRTNEELMQAYNDRASMLYQKSRFKWHMEGDRNTRFFHNWIKRRWNKVQIMKIHWRNKWCTNPEDIRGAFYEHFSSFSNSKPDDAIFLIDNLDLPSLSPEVAKSLVKEVSWVEVEMALNQCPSNKAPGPDGFNMGFLKNLWDTIGMDIFCTIKNFFSCGHLPPGMNSSFIALIPKKEGATQVTDFRPISLINSSMKLITKILAIRLNKVLDTLISSNQSGFMKGRQAADSILIACEVAKSLKSGVAKGLIFKIDFEKAFDTVSWDFLFHLLHVLKFDEHWISWLRKILVSTRASVLVNGVPTKEFSPKRGLRQGDPLSPLLFNLVAEVLHKLIEKGVAEGIIDPILINKNGFQISHLQYADDTIIFLRNDFSSIQGIKSILRVFQCLTGLKINFHKSTLYGFYESQETLMEWADFLGCDIGSSQLTYLGTDILTSSSKIKFWDPLIGKFQKRLQSWKSSSTTQAGRLILLKAALDSLPIYWLSLFKLPVHVEKKLEVIRKRFFWGSRTSNNGVQDKLHLIKWAEICKPKPQGGLGLVPLKVMNAILLFKWWWKGLQDRNKYRNQFLRAKYGNLVTLNFQSLNCRRDSSTMLKDIIQVCKGNQTLDEEWRNARWKLRNGNLILFWEDHWCDDRPLASKLSRLYNLNQFKFLSVREFYDCWRNNKNNYSLLWGRQLIGYEISEIIQLQLILEELIFTKGDDMLLMKSTQRLFTVRDCYVVCSCQNYGVNSIWMNIWSVMIPPKVRLFLWKFNHGILPLKSFLSVRLQGNFPSITCSWCRLGEENQFHLFYECELAQWAWSFISLWWDTDFSDIDVLTLDSLFRRISGDRLSKAWKVLVASVLWSIWLLRNELVFSNTRIKKKDFLSVISYRAKSWLHAAGLICEVYDHLWTQAPKDCVILSAKL